MHRRKKCTNEKMHRRKNAQTKKCIDEKMLKRKTVQTKKCETKKNQTKICPVTFPPPLQTAEYLYDIDIDIDIDIYFAQDPTFRLFTYARLFLKHNKKKYKSDTSHSHAFKTEHHITFTRLNGFSSHVPIQRRPEGLSITFVLAHVVVQLHSAVCELAPASLRSNGRKSQLVVVSCLMLMSVVGDNDNRVQCFWQLQWHDSANHLCSVVLRQLRRRQPVETFEYFKNVIKLFLSTDDSGAKIYDFLNSLEFRLTARAINRHTISNDLHNI